MIWNLSLQKPSLGAMCLSLSLFPLFGVQGVHFNFYFLYLSAVHFKPNKMYKYIQMFLWDCPALQQFVRIWHFAEAKWEWESESHCHAGRLEISNVRQLHSSPGMVNDLGHQIWVLIFIFLVISRFCAIPLNLLLCSLHKPDLYLQKYLAI